MPPTVSVCIPAYNREATIAQAIESACKQTFQDLEVVVVDNASSDRTVAIAKDLVARDSRIRVFQNDVNIGAVANFNRSMEHATGKYIKILMSDDLLDPTCIEKMVRAFETNPTVSLVSCAQNDVGENELTVRVTKVYDKSVVVPGKEALKHLLMSMVNQVGSPTSTMYRREDALNGYDCGYFSLGDMELWCQLLLKGDYCFINEPLATLHLHGTTGTSMNFRTLVFLGNVLQMRDQYRSFMLTQGLTSEEWDKVVDERIISFIDHHLLEDPITPEQLKKYANLLPSWIGAEYTGKLIESLMIALYYGYKRVHDLNIDARWQRGQVANLEREINGMMQTVSWKMTAPVRALRSQFKK